MIGKNEQAEILKYLLGQRYRAEKRKKQLDDRLEEMNERKRSPVGAGRISSAPKNQGKKAEEPFLVFRISEIEDRICRQKQEIENAVVRVMNIIEYLPLNSIEREICELRHIDMKPWNIISAEIPMSRSQVNRRYNAAIDMLLNNRGIQKLIAKNEKEYLQWKMERKFRNQKSNSKKIVRNKKPENKSEKNSEKKKKNKK
ncbi:hypothetical protein D3Z62_18000 [Lachnospiraceae bacterium]|jgi:hypothetical protein|nr:hypothetical protein [Lachnospiraceae bacterium]